MGTQLRADHYRMLRSPEMRRKSICELSLDFSDVEIKSIRVGKHSEAAGKTLGDLDLRKNYGVTILAISRNHRLMYDSGAETELNPDDIMLVISPPEQLEEIGSFLKPGSEKFLLLRLFFILFFLICCFIYRCYLSSKSELVKKSSIINTNLIITRYLDLSLFLKSRLHYIFSS